jgi:outer membrane protein insertion porin family
MGGSLHAGYMYSGWAPNTFLRSILGIEDIKLNTRPTISTFAKSLPGGPAYQRIISDQFKDGSMAYLNIEFGQDIRNHIIHPSGGFQWSTIARVGFPTRKFGFLKLDLDYSWYTSLIDEFGLVLGFHTHFGYVRSLRKKTIPFKELFNIGGPASVRGFEWGEISPSFVLNPKRRNDEFDMGRLGEPIGGTKAFFVNLELTFPIKKDHTLKGAIFYDGGSGWGTPCLPISPTEYKMFIRNSSFDYRQTIGIGFRMLQPQNLKVDWGFKLDRRPGEKAYEVHFSAYKQF